MSSPSKPSPSRPSPKLHTQELNKLTNKKEVSEVNNSQLLDVMRASEISRDLIPVKPRFRGQSVNLKQVKVEDTSDDLLLGPLEKPQNEEVKKKEKEIVRSEPFEYIEKDHSQDARIPQIKQNVNK